jgi:hypothetical protein
MINGAPAVESGHIDGYGFFVYIGIWLIFVEFIPNVPERLLLLHELTCQSMSTAPIDGPRAETPTSTMMESVVSEEDELTDDGDIWRWSKRRNTEDVVASEGDLAPELTDIYDVLGGSFRYEFVVEPKHCAMLAPEEEGDSDASDFEAAVVLQLCTGLSASAVRDAGIDALRGIDARIREGLLLVCPSVREDETRAKTSKSGGRTAVTPEGSLGLVRVTYSSRKPSGCRPHGGPVYE